MSEHHLAVCAATLLALLPRQAAAQSSSTPVAPQEPPPLTARADAPTAQDELEAREHFDAGIVHFNAVRYREAELDFSRGYALSHKPGFLWNMAESARSAGARERALQLYRRYLIESEPDAPRVEDAREWIATLEREQQSQAALAPERAARTSAGAATGADTGRLAPAAAAGDPARDDESSPIYETWWFWAGAGVLVAAGVASAVIVTGSDSGERTVVDQPLGQFDLDFRR